MDFLVCTANCLTCWQTVCVCVCVCIWPGVHVHVHDIHVDKSQFIYMRQKMLDIYIIHVVAFLSKMALP